MCPIIILLLNKKESKIASKVIVGDQEFDEVMSRKLILEAFEAAHKVKKVPYKQTSSEFPVI